MVRKKTQASIVGMAVGAVIVIALGLMAGLSMFASASISLIGVFLGGWIAEQVVGEEETFTTEESARRGTT